MKITLTISLLCSMIFLSGCFLRMTNDGLNITAASSWHEEAQKVAEVEE